MSQLKDLTLVQIADLTPWDRNARTHSKKQIRQIADSINTFGFTNPVLIDDNDNILAGHGRVEAAKLLGLTDVPCVLLSHMSLEQKRAYVIADNKLALNAGWDDEILATEFEVRKLTVRSTRFPRKKLAIPLTMRCQTLTKTFRKSTKAISGSSDRIA